MKKRYAALALAVLALGAGTWYLLSHRQAGTAGKAVKAYEYTQAKTGSIEKSISTSGTLQPVSVVKVVSQMSGRAEAIYADYNDRVKKGQTLVSLNTDMLKLQELQSSAALQKAQANYELQEVNFSNKEALFKKGLLSDYDYSAARTSLAVSQAELSSAKASYQVIETELNQYALIKSPIDGIVLDKNVEVGQTVVDSSSSTSSALFTLAEDLSSMEIKASVDELDITSVKAGQPVRFTVESQPGVEFEGSVKEIHLVPTSSNNVVSYYVIVEAPNKEGKLLPGMTADIDFIQEKREGILLVPNSALRYTPSSLSADEVKKLTFLARLPADQRAAASVRYDEALKKQASTKTQSSGSSTSRTGLAGLVMGNRGPGGAGGPPPGGFPGEGGQTAARTARSGSARSSSATSSAGSAAGTGGAGPTAQGAVAQGQSISASGTANGADGAAAEANATRKPLWYLDSEGKLACVLVTVGISDGVNTEISSSEDLSGIKFILREKAE